MKSLRTMILALLAMSCGAALALAQALPRPGAPVPQQGIAQQGVAQPGIAQPLPPANPAEAVDLAQLKKTFETLHAQAQKPGGVPPADLAKLQAAVDALYQQSLTTRQQIIQLRSQVRQLQNPPVVANPPIQINPQPFPPPLPPINPNPIVRPIFINPMQPGVPQPIVLVDGSQSYPTSQAGSMRVRLLPADKLNYPTKPGEALLMFEVMSEPRLKIVEIEGVPSVTKVIDDQTQHLVAAEQQEDIQNQNQAMQNIRFRRGGFNQFNQFNQFANNTVLFRLKLGDKQAKTLKELTGSLIVQVELPTEVVATFDNVLKAQNHTVKSKDGEMSITFRTIDKLVDGSYRIQYGVESLKAPAADNNPPNVNPFGAMPNIRIQQQFGQFGQVQANSPQLVDAKGTPYQFSFSQNNGQVLTATGTTQDLYTVTYRANLGQGEPVQLLVPSAISYTNVPVPFTFKDVPLPQ